MNKSLIGEQRDVRLKIIKLQNERADAQKKANNIPVNNKQYIGPPDPNESIVDSPNVEQLKNNNRLLIKRIREIRTWLGLPETTYKPGLKLYYLED